MEHITKSKHDVKRQRKASPKPGDVFVIDGELFANDWVKYEKGGTVTLLYETKKGSDSWRCIDQFGVGDWVGITRHVHDKLLSFLVGR